MFENVTSYTQQNLLEYRFVNQNLLTLKIEYIKLFSKNINFANSLMAISIV